MLVKIPVILIALLAVFGCDGNTSSLTSPMGGKSIGKALRAANDEIVEELGLEKGSDNPPFLSFEWWMSGGSRGLGSENADAILKDKNVLGERSER